MRAWLSVSVSAGLGLLVFACATGNTSFSGTGLDEGDPDSATVVPKPRSGGDASPTPEQDSATPVDASVAVPDSAPPDSAPPPGSGDCVGQNSSQIGGTYDDACDNFYFNSFGDSNPCTPGGNACAALNTSSLTFCCYKPLAGSYCEDDYGGTPQCLPK